MKAKRTTRTKRTAKGGQLTRVVRTTVGDLIAAVVETVGDAGQAIDLFTARSPLQRALRQRLVLE